jgi:hypothetical protein
MIRKILIALAALFIMAAGDGAMEVHGTPSLIGDAQAAPVVISGENNCPNCGNVNDDYMRWRNDAYNCVLGSYTLGMCTTAHSKFWKQYTGKNNIGVRIRECSSLAGDYGCVDVDFYWKFALPPLSTYDMIPWAMDVMLDYKFGDPIQDLFFILDTNAALTITFNSHDGEPHTTVYKKGSVPKTDVNLPTYPPQGPAWPPGHPMNPNGCSEGRTQGDLGGVYTCPDPPTGMVLENLCRHQFDTYWNPEPLGTGEFQSRIYNGFTNVYPYIGEQNKDIVTVNPGIWSWYLRWCPYGLGCSVEVFGGQMNYNDPYGCD